MHVCFPLMLTFSFCVGYQFDYVFDWTILKYPQIGSTSRLRVRYVNVLNTKLHLPDCNSVLSSLRFFVQATGRAGPSGEKAEKPSGLYLHKKGLR